MSVILLIAVAVILAGVIAVALGRGGELAGFAADVPPVRAEVVTAADLALIRPPTALFGYNPHVTDDLLGTLARTMNDRDTEIASLRRQLAELRASTRSLQLPARRPAGTAAPGTATSPGAPGNAGEPGGTGTAWPAGPAGTGPSGPAGTGPSGSAGTGAAGSAG